MIASRVEPEVGQPKVASLEGPGDFEGFFRLEYPGLAKSMILLTGDIHEAENLAQEAMARAYERWNRVKRMKSPMGYVYRIAFNLNRKRLRKRPPPPTPENRVSDDPAAVYEVRARILEALDSLHPRQREALLLMDWVGLHADEVGKILGVKAVSARVLAHRGREALRHRYEGRNDE
jgi:RNA polymerase sigma factor (sigma-70 family)